VSKKKQTGCGSTAHVHLPPIN